MWLRAPSPTGDPGSALPEAASSRSRLARVGSALLWYALPGFVLLVVVAYIGGATFGHANPPVVPVEGVSMRPALQAGDLVFLQGVNPETLRKGDIVAVNVPATARQKYNLPAHIVHRIVKVGKDAQGLVFTTEGDANPGPDVFVTHADGVVGKLWFKATGLGYPFLFFRSRQGEIFLGAAALIAVLYFGLGLLEERRIVVEGTAVTMQTVLEETQILRDAITHAETIRAAPAQPPSGVPAVVTPSGAPVRSPELDDLVEEVHDANARSRETSEVMRELVGAIGDYGNHLKSHTEVMMNLAATTGELHQATVAMRDAVSGRPETTAPAATPPDLPGEVPSDTPAEPSPADATPPSPSATDSTPPMAETSPQLALKRTLLGYTRESVDTVLAELTQRMSTIEDRLGTLAQRHTALQAERDALGGELARYRSLEQSLTDTLAHAKQAADEIRRRAEREAATILAAARASTATPSAQSTGESPAHPGGPGRRRPDDIGEGVYLPE